MRSNNVNETIDAYRSSDYERFRGYERYRFLLDKIAPTLNAASSVLDIGCAKGEFIWLARERWPELDFHGLELSEELVQLARAEPALASATFHVGDAAGFDLGRTFDVALLSGVLSIFDDPATPLDAMLKHLAPGGCGFIFGGICSRSIDVLARFRVRGRTHSEWQSGWNMFSIETIRESLGDRIDAFAVTPFRIGIDLAEDHDRPEASYTIKTADGERLLVTGGNIVREMALIEFRRAR